MSEKFRELKCITYRINPVSVFRVNDYRRKRFEPHISHELLRSDNAANNALMALAQRDAMLDCAAWLASGNTVAVSIGFKDNFLCVIIYIRKKNIFATFYFLFLLEQHKRFYVRKNDLFKIII